MINKIKSLQIYTIKNTLLDKVATNFQNADINTTIIYELCDFASKFALSGNIWSKYIAYFIATNINPFSLHCEYSNDNSGTIMQIAKYDLEILKELIFDDICLICNVPSCSGKLLTNYKSPKYNSQNAIATRLIDELYDDIIGNPTSDIALIVSSFYGKHGVGDIGMHKAFKLINTFAGEENQTRLFPIAKTSEMSLSDIIGCDLQKNQVSLNTKAFVEGKPANNVLLYGDGGTGKSSTIKAILNEYFDKGLRIIEIYKHEFLHISDIISQIKNRNYKFVLYLDDLSFEDFETEYKYFKAIIEGGMEVKPKNVLIYATSNRRHLIKETMNDKSDMHYDGELHRSDSIQEKLSLASRFGLSLFYGSPNQEQYLDIVRTLAKLNNICIEDWKLEKMALAWSMRNNGKSGRTAQQFINSLMS